MTNAKYIIVIALLWIWQFPQNLCALILRIVYRHKAVVSVWDERQMVRYIVVPKMRGGGVSMGNTVFVKYVYMDAKNTWAHEYGHCIQSRYLGPLYLLVIGLPSLIWAVIYTKSMGPHNKFYTEKWADKLGGVNRI